MLKEGNIDRNERGRRSHYEIFEKEDIKTYFKKIIFEQSWDAPEGTGEISLINNRTVLHSNYRKGSEKGYPIGARYLY